MNTPAPLPHTLFLPLRNRRVLPTAGLLLAIVTAFAGCSGTTPRNASRGPDADAAKPGPADRAA